MPYELIEVDHAGNSYLIDTSDSFGHICEQAVLAKRARPSYVYVVSNPENVDVDSPSGLTDEELEILP